MPAKSRESHEERAEIHVLDKIERHLQRLVELGEIEVKQGAKMANDFSKLQVSVDALTAAVGKLSSTTPPPSDQPTIDALTGRVDAATATVNNFLGGTTPPEGGLSIVSIEPTSGPVGTSVLVIGTGFTGVTATLFGSVPTVGTLNSDTELDLPVPAGAVTGPISVTTPAGTVLSPVFNVTP